MINLNKIDIKRTYLNTIKAIYNKATANIMLNGENLKFFLISVTKQGFPHLPLLYNIGNPSKRNQACKCAHTCTHKLKQKTNMKEMKLSIFTDEIYLKKF